MNGSSRKASNPPQKLEQKLGQKLGQKLRAPKPVSAAYLERAAFHYLGRYSATKARLVEVLGQKIIRRHNKALQEAQKIYRQHCEEAEQRGVTLQPPFDFEAKRLLSEEEKAMVLDRVQRCEALGYINDEAYARTRAESLFRRGKTISLIREDLRHKGLAMAVIEQALDHLRESHENIAFQAAINFARRRGFGPFSHRISRAVLPEDKMLKQREKQVAAFLRAGFSYADAKYILEAEDPESLLQAD